jgi:hypothetical protein
MDEVITRIVEIERQCSADVEQAERDYENRIDSHKRILEEKKSQEQTLIKSSENTRLAQAVEEAKKKTESSSSAFRKESERLIQDPVLKEAIKEDIISILLES